MSSARPSVEHGLEAEVRSAKGVDGIDGYDAVVVGGGVYAGRWHGDAVAFLKRYESLLEWVPTWLFSSGPTGGDPKAEARMAATLREQPGPPGNIAGIARRLGPRDHRTFAGRVTDDMGGIFARWIPKGDWRDFDAVRAWATDDRGFAAGGRRLSRRRREQRGGDASETRT